MRALLAVAAVAAATIAGLAAAAPPRTGLTYVPSPLLAQLRVRAAVAVSRDGRALYFLGGVDNRTSLAIFRRDPRTGKLSRAAGPEACVVTWIAKQTVCRRGPALNNSTALAVAPDGRDVAVGGHAVDQIALFRATPAGGLRFASCAGVRNGGFPCAPARGLGVTADLAFSPDGRNLYAVSSSGVVVLARNAATGALRQPVDASGCIQRSGRTFPESPPCATVPDDRFAPQLVRVLPDGGIVLVSSLAVHDRGLFVFRRDAATGALTLLSCFTARARPPCGPEVLFDSDVAVGADGRTLWGVSDRIDSRVPEFGQIDLLRLDPATGDVTQVGCFSTDGPGCKRVTVPNGGISIALAPDGRTLYAGGYSALRAYRVTGSDLRPLRGRAGCISTEPSADCTLIAPPGLEAFESLAVAPDGRDLYATGPAGVAFRIDP